MPTNSRLRRTAKKRNARRDAPKAPSAPIEPHAELRDQQGQLLAGIVRQDGEWVLGLGGQIAGGSDSAAHVLAMIKRAARLHEAHGTPVRLKFSDSLKAAALGEVEVLGKSFEAFEAELEASMASTKS